MLSTTRKGIHPNRLTRNLRAGRPRHLLALGHVKFAFIGGQLDHFTARERQRGFVQTLAEAAIGGDDYATENGEWRYPAGQAAM